MFKKICCFLAGTLLWTGATAAQETPQFSPVDRVVIVAPHPDDEALGLGGLIQSARRAGASVKIVYLTNGESNEVSALFYQKRPLLLRSDFLKSGRTRQKEAVTAMTALGLAAQDLIFFGYPDGGMLNIWLKHWGRSKAFRSFFTGINKVPYPGEYSYGHAYRSEEIVRDFETVLLKEMPTHLYVTAPFDLNADHQAAFLYIQSALLNLKGRLASEPTLYLYPVHAHGWPSPKKYLPEERLPFPTPLEQDKTQRWRVFPLSRPETQKKQAAILQYKSQIAYKKNFLLSFARTNELFMDYRPERLMPGEAFPEASKNGPVRYGVVGRFLGVDVPLTNSLDEMGALSVYLFGYRQGQSFSDRPKLVFKLFGNRLFVYDGARIMHDPTIVYALKEGHLLLRIPLRILKDPDYLFASTRNAKEELSLDFGSWRVLELVKAGMTDPDGKML